MSTAQPEATYRSYGWGFVLMQGIAALILGLFLVTAPAMAIVTAVLFLGVYWLVAGILSFVRIFTGTSRLNWFWAAAVGVLGILAGVLVLRHPLLSSIVIPDLLVLLLGVDAILMGLLNIYSAFAGDGVGVGIFGVVDIAFGAVLLIGPLVAAGTLTVLLGIMALIGGVVLIAMSFSMRNEAAAEMAEEQEEMRRVA